MSCSPVRYNPGQCIRFTHVYNLFVPMAIFVKPYRLVLLDIATSQHVFERISWEVMHAIRESVAQEEPVLQGIDRSSSSNSSVRNSSGSGPSLLSRLKKWGYSIFSMNLSATLRDSEVEDIRISHRRRVNRHTAPTEHPRFVIIGNTESASAAISDFKTGGMGPHYLILKDGSRRQLVKEKYMAWCYNFAFWESKDVGAPDDVPNTYPGVVICCIYCLGR